MHSIIQKIRQAVPLSVRIKVGPYAAYVSYWINIHLQKNRIRPHVLSIEDTVSLILKDKLSAVRFGDGEMSLIAGESLAFQKDDGDLGARMKEVLTSKKPGLLVCIPGIFEDMGGYADGPFWFYLHHLFKHGHLWSKLTSQSQTYGDAFITRPYLTFRDKSRSDAVFKSILSIWEGQDVVLVEGSKSRLGVGNDMFSKVKSMGRILCPPENAFSRYDDIRQACVETGKDKLILISLGPAAKVLAYDLFNLGYRVIDVGHLDMEYEMFLRKETKIVKVKYKYFNEIGERNPDSCDDESYTKSIIARIS